MKVKFSNKFKKQYKKASPKVQKAFEKRLSIFIDDKFHPLLNNHSLVGELSNYRSINVTGDWRALFRELDGKSVFFEFLGTHSQLYK